MISMASRSRKRNPYQYRNDNEQDQDQHEHRITRNNSSGLLHDYSHVQTSCNNGGDMIAESSNKNNQNQVQERIPLGLKLEISDSFINKIESTLLTQEKQENNHQEDSRQQPCRPKMKASAFPAVFLRIGSWNWASRNKGDLMIKFYYGRKKLLWEFLIGSLKKKMEIGWTNVSAINAYVDNDNMGRLEVELMEPPELYNECKFQPLKHTLWERSNDDFTGGQAQSCKRHTIIFSPGILQEHLEKLVQHDTRLLNLSQQPFPIHNSTYFNTNASYNHDVPSVQPITSCMVENLHSNDVGLFPGFANFTEGNINTSSSDCGLTYVACANDDVSGFPELHFINDGPEIQDPDSWLSSPHDIMNGELPRQDSNSLGGSSG